MISTVQKPGHATDAQDLAIVAEWLAQQFLNPLDTGRVRAARSLKGQEALRWIGKIVGQPAAVDIMCHELSTGGLHTTTASLQRRHTLFFNGIFPQYNVLPYASAWDGTGRLFGPAVDRMQAILKTLDVHVPADCPEPADHLAVQLAGMAEALRQEHENSIQTLLNEMQSWGERFGNALFKADRTGFYGNAARVLLALLDKIGMHCCAAGRQDVAARVALT